MTYFEQFDKLCTVVSVKRVSFYILVSIFVVVIGYIYSIILSVPTARLKKLERFGKLGHVQKHLKTILEEGSLVKKKDLQNYFYFTGEESSFLKWLEEQKENSNIELMKGDLILFKKSLELSPLLKNDCSHLYCYQHRVTFDQIPPTLWKALIGIEDIRFIEHSGVDPKSIARAIVKDIKALKFVEGGSTLTQQLVKNLFFTNEKKISRKIKEMIISIYLEQVLTKEEIIEAYFNEFIWGSLQGVRIKGIFSSSLYYFQKKPNELNNFEISILISLLKGPYYYQPIRYTDRLKDRTELIFEKLKDANLISKDSEKWSSKTWNSWTKKLENMEKISFGKSVWRVLNRPSFILNDFENYVFQNSVKNELERIKSIHEDKDLAVKAIIGRPFKNERDIYLYYSKPERNLEAALKNEAHSVGSTIKPIVYSALINHGKKLEEKTDTNEITLNLKSGKWSPKEYSSKSENIETTLKESLLRSYNRPLIKAASEVGFDKIEIELLKFLPNLQTPLGEYPAQLLGSIELTLEGIYKLYSRFVREQCSSNLSKEDNILYLLSDPQNTTVRKIVNKQMSGMSFFGKTGTSNKGFDNWFVFFDGREMGVIWFGYEGNRSIKSLNLSGGGTAFRIFQNFYRDRGSRFNELNCDYIMKSQ